MFSSSLSINDASAVSKSFVEVTSTNTTEKKRLDSTTDAISPRTMVIRHQTTGKGASIADRHNVVFSKTLTDAEGNLLTASVSMAVTVPRDVVFTQSVIDDLIAFQKNFFTTANTTSLLRGES
jgi:hypothetical protein